MFMFYDNYSPTTKYRLVHKEDGLLVGPHIMGSRVLVHVDLVLLLIAMKYVFDCLFFVMFSLFFPTFFKK